jgi:hypothetical protein
VRNHVILQLGMLYFLNIYYFYSYLSHVLYESHHPLSRSFRLVQLSFPPPHITDKFYQRCLPFFLQTEADFASISFLLLYKTTRRHTQYNPCHHCGILNVTTFCRIRSHLNYGGACYTLAVFSAQTVWT